MKTVLFYVDTIIDSAFARFLLLQSFIIMWCCMAFAQLIGEVPAVTNSDLFTFILSNFANFKGATTLVIVNLVAQILMKFGGTPLFDALKLDPKYKFLAFGILYFVVSISGLMIGTQMSIGEAISSSGLLLPLINYVYNIYEYFVEKKEYKYVAVKK